jgi:hypothetical protein
LTENKAAADLHLNLRIIDSLNKIAKTLEQVVIELKKGNTKGEKTFE